MNMHPRPSDDPAYLRGHEDGYLERDRDGQNLYVVLALFDKRDGTIGSQLVQAAREGWERSHRGMSQHDNRTAWEEYDRIREIVG